MIPMSLPPVETPELFIPGKTPGFGFELDQIKSPPPGGGSIILPFNITKVSGITVNVVYGTVMDLVPSGIATNTALTDGATNTIYLDCTINAAGAVTSVALSVTTSSLPASSTYSAILLVGVVVTASGAITSLSQSLYFSQGFSACGRNSADPATTPGTYEFFVR